MNFIKLTPLDPKLTESNLGPTYVNLDLVRTMARRVADRTNNVFTRLEFSNGEVLDVAEVINVPLK